MKSKNKNVTQSHNIALFIYKLKTEEEKKILRY